MNNIRCYSDSLLQNQPNERFRKEWTREQERIKVIDEMFVNDKIRMYKKWKIKMYKKEHFYFL